MQTLGDHLVQLVRDSIYQNINNITQFGFSKKRGLHHKFNMRPTNNENNAKFIHS
jgi:hypothetical protein